MIRKELISFLCALILVSVLSNVVLYYKDTELTNELEAYENTEEEYNEEEVEAACESALYEQSLIEPLKEHDKETYFELYKGILERYDEELDAPLSIYDCYDNDQITMMWKCIETETFECDFNAKVNVASVILNRVENDLYPTDPIEIITDDNQFAYGRNTISDETKLALEYAFMIEDTTDGCIGFRSDDNPTEWNGWTYQFEDEAGHYFYK